MPLTTSLSFPPSSGTWLACCSTAIHCIRASSSTDQSGDHCTFQPLTKSSPGASHHHRIALASDRLTKMCTSTCICRSRLSPGCPLAFASKGCPSPSKATYHIGFAQHVSRISHLSSVPLALVCLLRASPDIFVHEDRQLLMEPPDSPPSLDAHFHLQSGLSAFGVSPATELTLFSLQNHGSRRTHLPIGRIIDTTLTLRPVDSRAARSSCRAFLSPAPILCRKCALHLPDMTLFDA